MCWPIGKTGRKRKNMNDVKVNELKKAAERAAQDLPRVIEMYFEGVGPESTKVINTIAGIHLSLIKEYKEYLYCKMERYLENEELKELLHTIDRMDAAQKEYSELVKETSEELELVRRFLKA